MPSPRSIASGWVAQGPRVARFEKEFADAMQAPFAVATTSCTTALHLALIVAGIGPGDDVVVPSFSFIATTNAVALRRREPRLRRRRPGHRQRDRPTRSPRR